MNPADLTLSISPTLTTKALAQSQNGAAAAAAALGLAGPGQRNGRLPVPRVDLEPIYTQLKAALGDQWADYKAALNQFVLGHLNQAELSWVLKPLLSPTSSVVAGAQAAASASVSTLTLHNGLITAIYANTLRDPPPTDVAPWVVATDKPTSASKNAGASGTNDKAEERLKKEVMAIHARDRRRIKALKEDARPSNDSLAEMQSYRHELAVKPPETAASGSAAAAPAAGSSITKTNWDLEIRRRYAQPLAEETLEFPSHADLQNRIEPLCYEEGVSGGVAAGALQNCAELMEHATEVYLKELLGALCAHARANVDAGIATHAFRRQLRREEADADRGVLHRNPAGLLPVELDARAKRPPLTADDLRLAVQLRDAFLRQDAFLAESLALNHYPDMPATPPPPPSRPLTNGTGPHRVDAAAAPTFGAMDGVVDGSAEWSWQGGAQHDLDDLLGTLDECLAVG